MRLYLHKASKKLNIHPKLLKADIKQGRLHMDDAGCLDCNELKELYPDHWQRAYESNLDYYEGMKETAKQLTSPDASDLEAKRLYRAIRKLEAENYSLRKRVADLEKRLCL
jgi:hypothetical protein